MITQREAKRAQTIKELAQSIAGKVDSNFISVNDIFFLLKKAAKNRRFH
jgi:hypothetical protein